jgi:glycosyltransferase involved in cell wall biosynthesis
MLTYASPRIVPALLRYRPDVVLANSFGVWSLAALVFAPIGGWRVVIAYEGSSPGVDYADSRLRLLLRAAMARAADGLMTNTRNGALYLQSKLSVPPGRMAIQPYIVPSPELFDATSPLAPAPAAELRRPVFLVVAALVERKNVRCVLDACSRLPADSYSLVVVGVGPQRSELEAHAERVLGARRVVWLGHIPYREVGAHMRDADVLILPSLEDTLGTVVLEAMLCATPAVCSTGAGAAELVIDDENGFRFDARDPADLALRLRRFIDEPDLAGRLGRRAQQRMSELTPAAAVGALQRLLGLRAQSPRHRSGRS